MPSEPAELPGYEARKIEVLMFAEAVRRRSHMYFGANDGGSGLAAAVVRLVAAEALDTPEGTPALAELLIHSDLRFTVSDNVPVPHSDVVQPAVPYWHWSKELIGGTYRWGLAAAAALSSLAAIQVSSGGKIWRQEFTRGTARSAPADEGPAGGPGTRATFELDTGFFNAATAIPRDTAGLKPAQSSRRPGAPLVGTLTITDLRTQAKVNP